MKLSLLATLVVGASLSALSSAQTLFYANTLQAGMPTYNRPLSTTSLSGVGTAVFYSPLEFTVAFGGSYTFEMASPNGFDTFLSLYAGAFNPASPLTNLVAVNDDFSGNFTVLPGAFAGFVPAASTGSSAGAGQNPGSRFLSTLSTGVQYTAVYSSFSNGATGTFFSGIGPTTAVPEPASLAIVGVGLVAMMRRRRKA